MIPKPVINTSLFVVKLLRTCADSNLNQLKQMFQQKHFLEYNQNHPCGLAAKTVLQLLYGKWH